MGLQAASFKSEQDHQRKVQLFFSIMLTLLEQRVLDLKELCTPAALAADPTLDVEDKFGRIADAIRVSIPRSLLGSFVYSKRSCWMSLCKLTALAADPMLDIDAKFGHIANAIRVSTESPWSLLCCC